MKTKHFYYLIITLLLCFGTAARAQDDNSDSITDDIANSVSVSHSTVRRERIISFHSDITLKSDNVVEITERIKIYAMGGIFKRGLVRFIPNTRTDQYGHTKTLGIYLQEVKCNGQETEWHRDDESSDFKIYIGDADVFLEEGEYEYLIRYIAPGQIGQYDNHDEIYWNVNGFDWAVSFDSLSATVHLPKGTRLTESLAYTGTYSEKGEDYKATAVGDTAVTISATRGFNGNENMTIAVSFTKGSQKALTWWDIWQDDVIIWGMFAFFVLFCLITWLIKGIDPKMPTIVPQYTVPKGLSPAMVGRIMNEPEDKLLMSTILDMVVKGGAKIERVSKKEFLLTKGEDKGLDKYASSVFSLFFKSDTSISTKEDDKVFADARTSVVSKAKEEYENGNIYEYNSTYAIISIILFISFGSAALFLESTSETFWYSGIVAVIVFVWYFYVIGKYTVGGINTLADVEGLKMYMRTAEENRMRKMTPELFEELLPYAMAFGMENKWCKQFESVLASCNYEPSWYTSSDADYGITSLIGRGGMYSMMNSLSSQTKSSIKSYDNAHSASSSGGSWSSGGGGGGFSGGGGGGGGGGGW